MLERQNDDIFLPVMEEFYSIQGEGRNTGKAAYFIRLGGCDVGCSFCDEKESWARSNANPTQIKKIIERAKQYTAREIIVTGGEPLLYDLGNLTACFHNEGFRLYLETSGVKKLTGEWDWICLSAKKNEQPRQEILLLCDELKIIIENSEDFLFAEQYRTKVNEKCLLYLQPEWSKSRIMLPQIVEYIKQNPVWQLSLQTHKYINIP